LAKQFEYDAAGWELPMGIYDAADPSAFRWVTKARNPKAEDFNAAEDFDEPVVATGADDEVIPGPIELKTPALRPAMDPESSSSASVLELGTPDPVPHRPLQSLYADRWELDARKAVEWWDWLDWTWPSDLSKDYSHCWFFMCGPIIIRNCGYCPTPCMATTGQ
jgi:hypothetical protein